MSYSVIDEISKVGLVPVIKLDDPDNAVPLARALRDGGIPVAEVTFRAAGADRAIAAIHRELPDVLVGAGTVTTKEQVDAAIDAGAGYIITPGFDREIVEYCIEKGITVTPGCATAGDVSTASRLGLTAVKFFPAEAAGGVKMLKALAGPFSHMRFIPTGGITPDNLLSYLSLPNVAACGGSWMVPGNLVSSGDFAAITALAKQAILKMLDIKLAHIGINTPDDSKAKALANMFAALTGDSLNEIPVSYFCGQIEAMKDFDRGANGHLAFSVTSVERAVRYFSSIGFSFDESSAMYDESGNKRFIYFKDDFGGFSIHLTRA